MWLFYDFIFLIISLMYLPAYLFRRKLHYGFMMRLGVLPKNLQLNRPIWIHAVSVGEAMSVKGLLEEIRNTYPDKKFVISTVTPTGNKIAKAIAGDEDFVIYLPLDFSFIVKHVINRIRPSLFILTETEIWPNLLSYLYKENIPVVVVNGRISDRSFKGYRLAGLFIKPILKKVKLFCVQSKIDRDRLISLGVKESKIRITGNMKFDASTLLSINPERAKRVEWIDTTDYTDKRYTDYTDYRRKLGLKDNEKLLVAGSTHPGEEKIMLEVYKKLLSEFPALRLLIAPRHPARTPDIEKLISRFNFKPLRISQIGHYTLHITHYTVFILDTLGQLLNYYAISDIVFVGGSLVKKGGHNILEPASLGKPVLFGSYMFNFKDIFDLFLKEKAGILVQNKEGLYKNVKFLLTNPLQITEMSNRAKNLILAHQGATLRNLKNIQEVFK